MGRRTQRERLCCWRMKPWRGTSYLSEAPQQKTSGGGGSRCILVLAVNEHERDAAFDEECDLARRARILADLARAELACEPRLHGRFVTTGDGACGMTRQVRKLH